MRSGREANTGGIFDQLALWKVGSYIMAQPNDVMVKDNCVFFYGSYLSNFAPSDFTIDGISYFCAEQWMMAEKARLFGDQQMLQRILEEKQDQWKIKLQFGRNIKPFDKDKWSAVARDLVYTGLLEKFRQNPKLAELLLDTGDMTIVEASPTDQIWGIGIGMDSPNLSGDRFTWRGTNWLGEVLMRVRDTLKNTM